MLAKEYRLKGQKNFDRILKSPNTTRGQFLYIKFINNDLAITRFGLVVSNKISPKATKRNYIRRSLRQIIVESRKDIKSGFDIILLAKNNIIDAKLNDLREDLKKLLIQIKILNYQNV